LIQHLAKDLDPETRKMWSNASGSGLQKRIKAANENRNKLAHYSHDFSSAEIHEQPDGGVTVKFGESRLQPNPMNAVSRLMGRTPDKEEHNLGIEALINLTNEFIVLWGDLTNFASQLPRGTKSPFLNHPDLLMKLSQSQSIPQPTDDAPSDQ
jgi:hypothetical protein